MAIRRQRRSMERLYVGRGYLRYAAQWARLCLTAYGAQRTFATFAFGAKTSNAHALFFSSDAKTSNAHALFFSSDAKTSNAHAPFFSSDAKTANPHALFFSSDAKTANPHALFSRQT